ncbi:hypothetical protein C8Q79DRAFT_161355 [Trametes meyenii]|nr:hypothetical protein C8Q79DRAFT_161355 [Trametes meyenii]
MYQALKDMHFDEPASPDRRSQATLVSVPASSTTATLADETVDQAEFKHKTQPRMILASQPGSGRAEGRPSDYSLGTVMTSTIRPPISSGDRYNFGIQVYTAILRIHQKITEGGSTFSDNISPDLAIDTGSNMTWLFGYHYRRLVKSGGSKSEAKTSDEGYTLGGRVAETSRELLYSNPYQDMENTHDILEAMSLPGTQGSTTKIVEYVDGTRVWIATPDKKHDIEVRQCFDVKPTYTSEAYIPLSFRFGVAFAASSSMYSRPFNGVLALGLSNVQPLKMQPDPTIISAPSFPAALSLKEGRGKLRNPDTSETGIIFYMVLRKYGIYSSWVGLNRWPLPDQDQTPEWSPKIPTMLNSRHWNILIKSLEVLVRTPAENGSPSTWKPLGMYNFGDVDHQGMPVTLDTGSSVSWVPPELVRMLRTEIFPTPHNKELDTSQRDSAASFDYRDIAYRVPKESVRPLWLTVRFTFQGENGRDVRVVGPVDPFLFTANPVDPNEDFYEGLLYPAPRSVYIFGQNFFHSMFVSLHNLEPETPYRGRPRRCYVKLAPQLPEEIPNFLLPGESVL